MLSFLREYYCDLATRFPNHNNGIVRENADEIVPERGSQRLGEISGEYNGYGAARYAGLRMGKMQSAKIFTAVCVKIYGVISRKIFCSP